MTPEAVRHAPGVGNLEYAAPLERGAPLVYCDRVANSTVHETETVRV